MTEVLRLPEALPMQNQGSVITIGNFDGVHLGHRQILDRTIEYASSSGLASIALTFEPHPSRILKSDKAPVLIFPYHERLRLLSGLGLEYVAVQDFTLEFSKTRAEQWIHESLWKGLNARHIIVGYDFHFGYRGIGDAALLETMGKELGFSVEQAKPFMSQGRPVSSSRIRRLISVGEIAMVNELLGYPFHINGVVGRGERRGIKMGFPTANLESDWDSIPTTGVYACLAVIEGVRYMAGVNVGYNPTFGGEKLGIEVHLIDVRKGDLYDKKLSVHFIRKIRDERKFPGPDQLVRQVKKDVERAREILAPVMEIELR